MDNLTLSEFVNRFCDELDDTDVSTVNSLTVFKNIEEWDSLVALSIIAMIDEEFEVRVTGSDMLDSTTIEDLFNLVISKL